MKEIKAILGPQRLEGLYEVLRAVPGFPGMTVSRAEGYLGPSPQVQASIRAQITDHLPRVRIEMLVADEVADALYETVIRHAKAGAPGPCAVWVTEAERATFVHKTV